MATDAERAKAVKVMDLLVRYTGKVHYQQYRPMRTKWINTMDELKKALASSRGITMDCSEAVTLIAHIAGMHDPNNMQYGGWGYTGTILNYCKPHFTDPKKAHVGSLVVFGPGTGDHVCMVRKAGNDPLLFSHGGEYDPKYIRCSVMARYLRRPTTFCSINKL
jgi:hypothetical protein